MIQQLRSIFGLVVGLIATCSGPAVFGQGNTFNPYGNSGYADYREFTTPMYSNDPSLPGQARLQSGGILSRNRANQFDSYLNSLDGSNADQFNTTRGVPNGLPYYKAYQLYDKENKRAYRPNDTPADRLFQAKAKERDAAYLKALEEKNPAERARILRRLDQDIIDRPLGSISNKTTQSTPTPKSATTRSTPKPAASTPKAAARRVAPTPGTAPRASTTTPVRPTASTPAVGTSATTPVPGTAPSAVNPSSVPIVAPR